MRKFLLWFLAALLMTACGGCSATDDKVDGDEVKEMKPKRAARKARKEEAPAAAKEEAPAATEAPEAE